MTPSLGSGPSHDWLIVGTPANGSADRRGRDWVRRVGKIAWHDLTAWATAGRDPRSVSGTSFAHAVRPRSAPLPTLRHPSDAVGPRGHAQWQRARERLRGFGRATLSFAASRLYSLAKRSADTLLKLDLRRLGDESLAFVRTCAGSLTPARCAVVLAVLLIVLPVLYLAYCVATLPFEGGLVIEPTPSALTVEALDGQVFATRGVFKGEKLAPQEVPEGLRRAIVAIEDRHFYEHGGFYLPSMLRATIRNLRSGETREGGSTITQQLARMLYLSPERTFRRKLQEALLTIWLEQHLGKEEILTRYLNTAYFGAGVYGADAAAKRYFGKTAKELSLSEAAMLAGLVRAPSTLAPTRNMEGARARAALVLNAMVKSGTLTAEQAAAAREHPASLRLPPDNPAGTNYFVDLLGSETKRLAGSVSADLKVHSTLDLNLQSIAEDVIARRLKAEGRAKKVEQAALVAMAPDGAILAMVGGRDYNESQFNRATQAKRQPGSLFKLFVYLAAFEKGFNPDTAAVDRPVAVGDWEPDNYGGHFRGPVSLRAAFANSLNSVAVQLTSSIGVQTVIDTAHRLGVTSELPAVPSLALGSADVNLLEMTRAFAAIAANAEGVEPYTVRTMQKGEQTIYERAASALKPAGNPAARAAMRDLLASVIREGTGRAARVNGAIGGKTGTSQEYRNAWFVGFTNDIIVGVWVGNDDNTPMRNVVGGDIPARIWSEFISRSQNERMKVAQRMAPAKATAAATTEGRSVPNAIRGVPGIRNTATLEIAGRSIRLFGVTGIRGMATRDLQNYLHGREVICEPLADTAGGGYGNEYRCRVDNQDLSRVVLYNGGGRASATATPELKRLEQQARTMRFGIWSGRDDDDD